MKIEHFALQVEDPVAVAQWYGEHLGLVVKRTTGAPTHTHFLADDSGQALVEFYNNPRVTTPDYAAMDPLLVHIAFVSDDPAQGRDRLLEAGATLAEDLVTTPAGDQLVMLRDPWGLAVQLVKRSVPMLQL